MTNKKAKFEAIKKAYGQWFHELEDLINQYGTVTRIHVPNHLQNIFGDYFWDNQDGEYWPKSITGLYKNNGWIRIEPDGSNLPDIHIDFIWLRKLDGETKDKFHINGHSKSDIIKGYSHYKPIEPELKPIY